MAASIQYLLFSLIFIISKVSTQNHFPTVLTCYTNSERTETRNQLDGTLMHYSYHQAEISVHTTLENEPCSTVGCACFSYKVSCSNPAPGNNHHSKCNNVDRQTGTVKWHYGWTSIAKCEEMRQESQKYPDLTCCQTDRCNDQPGLVVKNVEPNAASQYHSPDQKPGESYTGFIRGNDVAHLREKWEQHQNPMSHPTATERTIDQYQSPQPYHVYSPDSAAQKSSQPYDDYVDVDRTTVSHMDGKHKLTKSYGTRVHRQNTTSIPITTTTTTTTVTAACATQSEHDCEKSASNANLRAANLFANLMMLVTFSFCFYFMI